MNAFSITNAFPELAASRLDLFEASTIAIHEIDTKGVIRSVNQAECQLLGYSPDELIGHHIWEFAALDQQQVARDTIAGKIARQQPVSTVTREYRRGDGSYIWLEIHEKLIENAEGEVVGIRSALLDITEYHKLETEMRKQLDWMRVALRSFTRAIVTADALGNMVIMNPAAEALTGWRQEEAAGRPLEQICRVQRDCGEPVDLMSCVFAQPMTSNLLGNFSIVDRSGVSQPVQWSISPILNDDDVIVGATLFLEKR
jgi:PAS domain S-box-containing protein